MTEAKFPLHLTSPNMRGQQVKNAQFLLKHNRFNISFYKGDVDGQYGEHTAQGANDARYLLGYSLSLIKRNKNAYGNNLHKYLLGPKRHGKRLTLPMLARRKIRLRDEAKNNTVKAKALALAHTQVGVKEYPYGSNAQKFGLWYGLNREPWCAIFVTYCFVNSGDKRTFQRSHRTAWAFWPLNEARSNSYGLSLTNYPEPGDLVVYTRGEGHIGIFDKWIDQRTGLFQTVEGNTSGGNDSNGGEVQIRQRRVGDYMQPHFIRYK